MKWNSLPCPLATIFMATTTTTIFLCIIVITSSSFIYSCNATNDYIDNNDNDDQQYLQPIKQQPHPTTTMTMVIRGGGQVEGIHFVTETGRGGGGGPDRSNDLNGNSIGGVNDAATTTETTTAAVAAAGLSTTTTTTTIDNTMLPPPPPLLFGIRTVLVTIPNYGRVQGKREGGIDFFGGIPYATPPVGNLRWAPPEPPSSWMPSTLDATQFGPDCWQMVDPILNPNVRIEQMSEDCLYLNVFTPAGHAAAAAAAADAATSTTSSTSSSSSSSSSLSRLRNPLSQVVGWGNSATPSSSTYSTTTTADTTNPSDSNQQSFTAASSSSGNNNSNNNSNNNNKAGSSTSGGGLSLLPVMVWFHGGAFQMGGARRPEYDGRRLAADQQVVVVTFNYRLGALGFLVSSPDGLYGNFGLMDQRAVLSWIHDNIQAFGGDPNNITLFGESAGAVMIGLHLMMKRDVATTSSTVSKNKSSLLFHKAILQSNPLGYTFRTVVVDDFIGEALKRSMDCRDLACLRSERVEEIMRAQSNLMGIPRSVGDFFTWGPTLTTTTATTTTPPTSSSAINTNLPLIKSRRRQQQQQGQSATMDPQDQHGLFRNLDLYTSTATGDDDDRGSHRRRGSGTTSNSWATVNVSQPLKHLHLIPDDIPIIIGSNKHEGEIFVHSAFPIAMSKFVYWMFVGALFRDSASRVLKHYRGYVHQIEQEAADLAKKQLEEEENKLYYLEHQEQLEHEYDMLLAMNATRRANYKNIASQQVLETLVKTWSVGGGIFHHDDDNNNVNNTSGSSLMLSASPNATSQKHPQSWWPPSFLLSTWPQQQQEKNSQWSELQRIAKEHRMAERAKQREEKRRQRQREKALKEAAKVVVDYRPVMSRIIDDYLFRCPSWHYAHIVSRNRVRRGNKNNVFVYRFSQPTHIPGFKECWGKSCHTAELPYVFQAMDVIRSNYSTLGPYAQKEAPTAPEYPYSDLLEAYRGALEAVDQDFDVNDPDPVLDLSGRREASSGSTHFKNNTSHTTSTTRAFQRLLFSFFGDYFAEDADEEIASDMAERWASFARSGDPNYDGSKVEWLPWRYIPSEDDDEDDDEWNARMGNNRQQGTSISSSQEDYWNDAEFLSDDENDESAANSTSSSDGFQWSNVKEERAYRRRALRALGMEVVEEDSLRTELRRVPRSQKGDLDRAFLISRFLFRSALGGKHDETHARVPKRVIRQVQRLAQDMGVLGTGLQGEDPRFADWDDDFFPELLELKWPPEGRLVERDCTCDMWDRIRYRY